MQLLPLASIQSNKPGFMTMVGVLTSGTSSTGSAFCPIHFTATYNPFTTRLDLAASFRNVKYLLVLRL